MEHVSEADWPPNPYDESDCLSFLLFLWPAPLIKLGSQKTLTQSDLPGVSRDDNVRYLGSRLTGEWNKEVSLRGSQASLARALFISQVIDNWYVGVILIMESALRIYQAQVLGRFIRYILTELDDPWITESVYNNGYFLSFILVMLGASVAFLHHHAFFHAWRLGMQLRGSLTTLIYDKAIKLTLSSMSSISVGHIVNLCAQDVESFQICGCFVHFCYTPLLEALVVLYFGLYEIGISFLAGFACIILLIPLQKMFSTQLTKSKGATSKHTDERLKVLNQALNGVRLMKINGWEDVFISIIENCRQREVDALLYTNIMRGLNEAIFFAMPIMIAAFVFITYNRLGGTLTTSKIFIVLTYFNIVQFSMAKFFSTSIASLAECHVAIKRIERLLLLDEVPLDGKLEGAATCCETNALEFSNFSASWVGTSSILLVKQLSSFSSLSRGESAPGKYQQVVDQDKDLKTVEMAASSHATTVSTSDSQWNGEAALVLQDVTLTVTRGELVVIVGAVGCGKSSLLLAALGELPPISGSVRVAAASTLSQSRSIAYCAQTPFIISSTFRDNILFNLPFDQERYDKAISSCALVADLNMFSHGDLEIIGDKGINLSGGQKARVGLARAVYADKDLYLLDDPLSAVDTHVGAHLFDDSICDLIRRGKTVVLATHQIQYLKSPLVSRVVVVDNGRVVACGKYSDLASQDSLSYILQDPSSGLRQNSSSDSLNAAAVDLSTVSGDDLDDEKKGEDQFMSNRARQNSSASRTSQSSRKLSLDKSSDELQQGSGKPAEENGNRELSGIVVEEDKESGNVRARTYIEYSRNLGGPMAVFYLCCIMAAAQVLAILANYWLSYWSSKGSATQQELRYINTYIGIVVGAVVASIARAIIVFHSCIKASQKLHNKLLSSVIRTKILFFDSNPIGRILNRFAKDVAFCDDLLPNTLYDCVQCILMCIGAILVVCSAVPYIFLSLLPLIWFFMRLRAYFLKTSREVKRLESLSRSPIFSHLAESLDGVVTIRAYGQVEQFQHENKFLLNNNVRGYFTFVAIARWLGFNLDATVIGLLVASTFGAVLAKNSNVGINNAAISVGIMYIIQLTGLFQWAVRQTAEVESLMVSVERILAYSDLEPEGILHGPADVGPGSLVRPNWPETGHIQFNNLSASYRDDLPPVLNNVTFTLEPGMRVGIVGRSGCGKSTLVSTIMRLVDITQGSITVDGVDITSIGLHDFRPKISVIQQNPFLFSGTIRENLDPWIRYTDDEIWSALDCVCLKTFVQKLELGLSFLIEEGGQNFSTGERQLVCLARAILQRNKILIMDEATANIDNETDMRVQQAIFNEFTKKGCMVLAVAHRLVNIMDFDLILVMSNGFLHESGHPHDLLSKHLPVPPLADTDDSTYQLPAGVEDRVPKASFASLVLQTGHDMSLRLRRMAHQAKLAGAPTTQTV